MLLNMRSKNGLSVTYMFLMYTFKAAIPNAKSKLLRKETEIFNEVLQKVTTHIKMLKQRHVYPTQGRKIQANK